MILTCCRENIEARIYTVCVLDCTTCLTKTTIHTRTQVSYCYSSNKKNNCTTNCFIIISQYFWISLPCFRLRTPFAVCSFLAISLSRHFGFTYANRQSTIGEKCPRKDWGKVKVLTNQTSIKWQCVWAAVTTKNTTFKWLRQKIVGSSWFVCQLRDSTDNYQIICPVTPYP